MRVSHMGMFFLYQNKTGGLVIWRSGSMIVLYRGMTYHLPCVQSYSKQNQAKSYALDGSSNVEYDAKPRDEKLHNKVGTMSTVVSGALTNTKTLSKKELLELSDLNNLLDEIGPRFKDWSGCEPLPVDADLLPGNVPGYKPPTRILPYGVRHCLKNKDVTIFRRLARNMPPHFALGTFILSYAGACALLVIMSLLKSFISFSQEGIDNCKVWPRLW